jgi:hypothetical protein
MSIYGEFSLKKNKLDVIIYLNWLGIQYKVVISNFYVGLHNLLKILIVDCNIDQ